DEREGEAALGPVGRRVAGAAAVAGGGAGGAARRGEGQGGGGTDPAGGSPCNGHTTRAPPGKRAPDPCERGIAVQTSYRLTGLNDDRATVDATGLAEPEDGRERAYLIVTLGADRTRVIELPDGAEISFGRSRGATLVIDHEKVSRMHARVLRRGPAIVVEDLNSTNRTHVN